MQITVSEVRNYQVVDEKITPTPNAQDRTPNTDGEDGNILASYWCGIKMEEIKVTILVEKNIKELEDKFW